MRRQTTKFNGVSYVVQRAAEAIYTPEGQRQCKNHVDYYLRNARVLKEGLSALGFKVSGGTNAPYVWLEIPAGYDSWSFFDALLEKTQIVATPGSGFGACGEGHIRLSAFGRYEDFLEALERMKVLAP